MLQEEFSLWVTISDVVVSTENSEEKAYVRQPGRTFAILDYLKETSKIKSLNSIAKEKAWDLSANEKGLIYDDLKALAGIGVLKAKKQKSETLISDRFSSGDYESAKVFYLPH